MTHFLAFALVLSFAGPAPRVKVPAPKPKPAVCFVKPAACR